MKLLFSTSEYKEKRIALQAHIKSKIPKFEERSKKDSKFMLFLDKLLFFVKGFLTNYATTFYPYIYFVDLPYKVANISKDWNEISYTTLLGHEFTHLMDRKNWWCLFTLLYISPQILALLAILSFWNIWFLFALLCLAPIPSIGRAWIEYRGYRTSMAIRYWLLNEKLSVDWIVDHFVGSSYYWMFPFRKYLTRKFEETFVKIVKDDLTPFLREIKEVLLSETQNPPQSSQKRNLL